jgi:hypothetical protein
MSLITNISPERKHLRNIRKSQILALNYDLSSNSMSLVVCQAKNCEFEGKYRIRLKRLYPQIEI